VRLIKRLAVRSALVIFVCTLASGLLALAFGAFWGVGGIAGFAIVVSLLVFYLVDRTVSERLEASEAEVALIRRKQFEHLEHRGLPHGDEIDHLNWQICRTGMAMEKEIAELRKVEDYRREFLGNVSHELKTPIFAIQGFAETLRDGALEDERVNRSFLDKILRNSDRLNTLVRDLAEISRIETGELKMNMEPFRMQRLCGEVADGLEHRAAERQVVLRNLADSDAPVVVGDVERIRQVLVNLVDNAIKYSNDGGRVELSLNVTDDGGLRVAVKDDGIGIAPQDVPRLTERFYRVDRSRSREAGGTGLGLSIVKHILAAHGMSLAVKSTPGDGAEFSFTFPPESVRGGSTYVRADVLRGTSS
jgi:two-component system, OmpR family, phosphate regulon sensor histidine kinase PhoR